MPVKGYRKHNSKNARIDLRVTAEEKARWAKTAAANGYDSMADMIRDLIEQLNRERVAAEIMDEIKDVKVGDAIIV